MAGPLKKIGKIFHFTNEQLYGTQEQKLEINKHWNISAREFLQKFGTEICRNILPKIFPTMSDIWITLFKITYNPHINYVISDIRFIDEAKVIKKLGGIIIRVVRDNKISSKSGNEHKHASEIEISKIKADHTINNNKALQDLYNRLDHIIGS